jgi:hypothetical protein
LINTVTASAKWLWKSFAAGLMLLIWLLRQW